MKRVYVSLTNRVPTPDHSPNDYGEVILLDWEKRVVLASLIVDAKTDIEYGRSRGASGLGIIGTTIYVASKAKIFGFDIHTNEKVYEFDPGGPKGYHGLVAHEGYLHVACMGSPKYENKKLILNPYNNFCVWQKTPYSDWDGGCFNAIGFAPNGEEYHMYSGPEQIVNFNTKRGCVSGIGSGTHDIVFLNDREILYTESNTKSVMKADIMNGNKQLLWRNPEAGGDRFNIVGYTRGLAVTPDGQIFVTTSPGTLHMLGHGEFVFDKRNEFPDNREPCPFDICLHPEDWN